MRFERVRHFNRIFGHLSGPDIFKVDFIPYDNRINQEFSISAGSGKLTLGEFKETFQTTFYGYLINNYSIGLSRTRINQHGFFKPDTDLELLVVTTCRAFTESEIIHILGGYKDFFIEQPLNGKHIVSAKFRNHTDILVHSFFYRQRKSVGDLFRFLTSQERIAMYRSILSLSLLGYLTIHEEPLEMAVSEIKNQNPSTASTGRPGPSPQNPVVTQKVNALQRLFSRIAGI